MTDHDRWEDDPYDDRAQGRERRPRRREEFDQAARNGAPRIGPTGMMSGGSTGDIGTSGRYFDDMEGRADYGGFGGGAPNYGAGPARRENVRRYGGGRPTHEDHEAARDRRLAGDERLFAGGALAYGEYGREHGGFGAGGGYTPNPREGIGREERSWTDKAGDEVKSWFGDANAEQRRDWDAAAEGHHRGRGPKDYKRSDARIHEDVNDRLTDDPVLDASDIAVTVSGGEVTLNGTVTSRFAKRRAEDCADAVSGVGHVQNNLRVNQTPRPGTIGAETDPRVAAVSEGQDADEAAKNAAEGRAAPDNSGLRLGPR
jgi:osmotically-inducible protein OsmY